MELQSTRVKENDSQNQYIDIASMVDQSKINLQKETTKRVRRTKAEIEAAKNGSGRVGDAKTQNPQLNQALPSNIKDRKAELKPAILLYSDLFIARPIGIDALKFTDTEADALAQVTSDLMNAFPEYFNNSDPRVGALISAAIVCVPIGFSKYKIYKAFKESEQKQDAKTNSKFI